MATAMEQYDRAEAEHGSAHRAYTHDTGAAGIASLSAPLPHPSTGSSSGSHTGAHSPSYLSQTTASPIAHSTGHPFPTQPSSSSSSVPGPMPANSGAGAGAAPPRPSMSSRQDSYTESSSASGTSHSHSPRAHTHALPPQSQSQVPAQSNGAGGARPGMADHRQSSGGVSGVSSVHSPVMGTLGSLGSLTLSGSQGGPGMALGMGKDGEAVPVGFDEGILRGLCEMDCALALLADRIKQSIASCKQVAVFFRSRAEIEEKYARSLVELGRTTSDLYARADCKSGTFVTAYHSSLRLQDQLAQNRIRFSQRLVEMADELLALAREGEKLRKQHKDNGARYQGILQESEVAMDKASRYSSISFFALSPRPRPPNRHLVSSLIKKAKARFDQTAEELERLLVAKEGESMKESGMRSSASTTSNSSGGIAGGGASGSGGSSGGSKKAFNKAMSKGGMLFKGKGPASIAKQEDEVRGRMAQASETFRKAVLESQGLRQEYFNFQLPKILRLLKECADELDLGTQYHLTRFAFLYESTVVGEGTILSPMGGNEDVMGLKQTFESIDNRTDFKSYMQNYAVARGTPRGPRRDGPYEEGFLPPMPPHIAKAHDTPTSIHAPLPGTSHQPSPSGLGVAASSLHANGGPGAGQKPPSIASDGAYAVPGLPASTGASFGVDLGEQLARDGKEVPKVVEMCAKAIEAHGIDSMGIYRLSGTSSRVQALKKALDTDPDNTDVMSDEWSADINVVSGALKLWFRELPEPLLTHALYHQFIEAARYENDRLRHIRLHEQVNELPDPNYATLKFFMGHLDRIRKHDSVNQMSVSNLSIVFGPTLLGAPPEEGGLNLEHMSYQCKAIETILEKYHEIFVEEDGSAEAA